MNFSRHILLSPFCGAAVCALAAFTAGCEGGDHAARSRGGICLQHDRRAAQEVDFLFRSFQKATGSDLEWSGRYESFTVTVFKWGKNRVSAGEIADMTGALTGIMERQLTEKKQMPKLKDCDFRQTNMEAEAFLNLLDFYNNQKYFPAP